MRQRRQGVQSTSSKNNNQQQKQHQEPELMLDIQQQQQQQCAYIHRLKPSKEGTAYSDLTDRYPIQSFEGNNYILIIYHYNFNAILAEPIKNREKGPY